MNALTDELIAWIDAHRNDDVHKLRLRHCKDKDITFAILQIECRNKAQRKLPFTLSHPHFIFPTALSAEQCTSDALADFHTSLIHDSDNVLDMTCGLGIDSFHFARKASSVTAVELNPDIADAATINANALALDNITIISGDSVTFLESGSSRYDTIFIDPARRGTGGKRLYALSDCEPDVTSVIDIIRNRCSRLIIKASPMLDISKVLTQIPFVSDVYAIGTRHECKEIVIIADFTKDTPNPARHAVTISDEGITDLKYLVSEEQNAIPSYAFPQEGHYLYEPFPSIMKAAPFKLLSTRYRIAKLHPNTHLYSSSRYAHDFPGDIFRIDRIIPFSSKEIKNIAHEYQQINVATRNFILSTDALRRRLKVNDGGSLRLIGTTTSGNIRLLLILSAVPKNERLCLPK